jgi:hypothetical protein
MKIISINNRDLNISLNYLTILREIDFVNTNKIKFKISQNK